MGFLSKQLLVVAMVCGFVVATVTPVSLSYAATSTDYKKLCAQLLSAYDHSGAADSSGSRGFNVTISLIFENEPSDGILHVVRELIEKGTDGINHQTEYGDTALSMAISKKHFDVADYLLDQPGINVNTIDTRSGRSPLLEAVSVEVNAPLDLVRKLIQKGADVSRVTASDTVLTGAIQRRDIERLRTLITELGLAVRDEDMIDASQIRDLTQSRNREVLLSAEKTRKQVLQVLLQNGGNPNALSGQGFNPLINVLFYHNDYVTSQDTVELLIRAGADVNHQTEYGDTALSMAIGNKDFATADYLLKIENINVRTVNKRNGHTVLQEAAFAFANSGTLYRIAQLEAVPYQSPAPQPQAAQVQTKKEKFVCPDEKRTAHDMTTCKHCIRYLGEDTF